MKKTLVFICIMLSAAHTCCGSAGLTQKQKDRAIEVGSMLITDYYHNIEIATVLDTTDFDKKDVLLTKTGTKYFRVPHFEAITYTNDFGDCLQNGDKVSNYMQYKDFLEGDNKLCRVSPKIASSILGHSNIGYDNVGDYYFFFVDVKVDVQTPNVETPSTFDKASNAEVYFFVTFKPNAIENAEIKFERTLPQNNASLKKYAAVQEVPLTKPTEIKKDRKTSSYIVFDVYPVDAQVKVDDKSIFYVNKDQFPVSQGRHKISIEREGYSPVEKEVNCSPAGQVAVSEKLAEQLGDLEIQDNQNLAGSIILIDNVELGQLPKHNYKLRTGYHKITIKRSGFLSHSDGISINTNQTTTYTTKRLLSKQEAMDAGLIAANGVVAMHNLIYGGNKIMDALNRLGSPQLPHKDNKKSIFNNLRDPRKLLQKKGK